MQDDRGVKRKLDEINNNGLNSGRPQKRRRREISNVEEIGVDFLNDRLPLEILFNIFEFLPFKDLSSLSQTCKAQNNTLIFYPMFDEKRRQVLREKISSKTSSGELHSLCVTLNGRVHSWGRGNYGRLGQGMQQSCKHRPEVIQTLSGTKMKAVSAGFKHSMALSQEGRVCCWGKGEDGQLGKSMGFQKHEFNPHWIDSQMFGSDRITAIAAGGFHSLCLSEKGVVYAWGQGVHGQLGHGGLRSLDAPLPIDSQSFNNQKIVAIAAGAYFSLALSEKGQVFWWGMHQIKRLVINARKKLSPTLIEQKWFQNHPVISISAGWYHSIALTQKGDVYSWGAGTGGTLGLGDLREHRDPVRIDSMHFKNEPIVAMACGWNDSFFLTKSGKVYACGEGYKYGLGDGTDEDRCLPVCLDPTWFENEVVVAISAGGNHSLCVTETGKLYSWGEGLYGRLGQGDFDDRIIPTQIQGFSLFSNPRDLQESQTGSATSRDSMEIERARP